MAKKHEEQPPEIMSPESFAEWMSFSVSSDFLTPERLELLRRMTENLARDPALLKFIERMLADYDDDIRRVSPSDAELEKAGFGWTSTGDSGTVRVAPAAAAAAVAPGAAAMAAAHVPGE